MKTLRKTIKCLNCGQSLSEVYDYCPLCGQENTNNNVSFKQLVGDFFSNYFSLDSKFFRSIVPFLIKPGFLTNSFNDGKRKTYANPVRLYIIISFLYFFVLSFLVSDFSDSINKSDDDQAEIDSAMLTEVIPQLDSLNPTQKEKMDSLGIADELDLLDLDSIGNNYGAKYYKKYTNADYYEPDTATSFSFNTGGWPLTEDEWAVFMKIKDEESLNEQQIFDSLKVDYRPLYTQHAVKQIIKTYKANKEYLIAFIIKNFSLMMFIMLPVFALILKLLYVRRKILYINHLVHTIHIHSFSFLIYGIALAISIWVTESDWISNLAFLLVSIYCYLSFKTVYKQSHKKTFAKFFLTGMIYSFIMLFAFMAELFISLLIF